ncbi:MAG: PHP-associated domain-containing protein [Pseudomonadota bacterium]
MFPRLGFIVLGWASITHGFDIVILDMHNHSIKSDDGRAKVENYCQWIRSRDMPIDGIVLTEHRQFEPTDYSPLEKKYGLVILEGSEVETEYGHVLVYGVTDALMREFDFARVDNPLAEVLSAVEKHGAIAAPAHPGRPRVGMFAQIEELGVPEGIGIVEVYNGGSRADEDRIALENAEKFGYLGIGGSDAHIVSHIGRCGTRFPDRVESMGELVEALAAGEFEAVTFQDKK